MAQALRAAVDALLRQPAARWLAALLGLLPALWLLVAAAADRLGANPAEALIRGSGDWALRLLCLALAVTPLRVTLGLPALARWRRMAGLYAYGYALLHLLTYLWLDQGWDWGATLADVAKRPFILAGMVAVLLLTPLAATSWAGAMRRLGAARWQRLHRLVYAVAVLAVLHFYWMRAGKRDFADVWLYGSLIALLLLWRLWRRWGGRGRSGPADLP
ncbi:MAG: sulfite oxidase heme-binding subunit YedZ [Hylemonella sp.]